MAECLYLGCTQSYRAVIISKDGIALGELPISDVEWSRALDDISEATITVPMASNDCAPCDIVADINPWHHELYIFRDDDYVWSGPIVNIRGNRSQVTIVARDLFQLMEKRIIHEEICFDVACGGAPADLSVIGKAIIDDAFARDGHNYEVVVFNQTGLLGGQRLYTPGEQAFNSLQEAMRLGLDATVLGSRIIIGAAPFGSTRTLTSEDFQTDLEFEVDGLGMATRAITLDENAIGVAVAATADEFGVEPYYGLIEYVSLDRHEFNTTEEANVGAQALIDALFPAPTILSTPTGARLSPNAPICISELVPGVLIQVITTDLCREVSGNFILTHVDVSWSSEAGEESVQITLSAPNTINSGEQ